MWAVIKKEFKSYFYTPIGYIFIGVFLIAFSISFALDLVNSGGIIDFGTIFVYMFNYWPTIIAFAILIPLITMRTFAEERKSGTEQLLLTSPINITKIVLGKFFATLFVVLIAIIGLFMYIGILYYFGKPDLKMIFVTMLGFLLFLMSYISFGILASSITENQIISAIVSILFFIVSWVMSAFNANLQGYSFMNMFFDFTQGQIDIGDTVTFITFTITCLLLTITVIQRRKSIK